MLDGLSGKQKTLPCKYLYDETGSRLFERICELDDYYLTRTEAAIFAEHIADMAEYIGPQALIVEPGAGNCEKVEPLLEKLAAPRGYFPIDISPEILLAAQSRINARLPDLEVRASVGDFTQADAWQPLGDLPAHRKVVFFPGSTIGNFVPLQAEALLELFASNLDCGDGLLIGTDLVKDSVVLERAYCDSEHVTEEFNKNILARINTELSADFELSHFAHRAFYHPLRQRVEMHLVSLTKQCVNLAGTRLDFAEGETIHTENSHKYTLDGFSDLLRRTGFTPIKYWTDRKQHYAIHFAQAR
ncbi:L-histidine N(alpha)-methyltransferase [Microbulbifer magnicolonia]|uniref:L-histidine N(alpha)-methyltransferase n=1 Tax=Microbulbifer magnicolonia TaxID=3109744 RepID=UPI002B40644C|nr:L-histidine N(alpha)-methyltransferase [Microbulbifer sp. GG15]